jgi:hypothetical protein
MNNEELYCNIDFNDPERLSLNIDKYGIQEKLETGSNNYNEITGEISVDNDKHKIYVIVRNGIEVVKVYKLYFEDGDVKLEGAKASPDGGFDW